MCSLHGNSFRKKLTAEHVLHYRSQQTLTAIIISHTMRNIMPHTLFFWQIAGNCLHSSMPQNRKPGSACNTVCFLVGQKDANEHARQKGVLLNTIGLLL